MKTFYVQTGDVKEVIVAPSAREAVKGALIRSVEKELVPGLLIACNTVGFGEYPDNDLMFVTENELKALRFNVTNFLKGFTLTKEQWMAYQKIKQAIEAFQQLLSDTNEL